MKHLTVVYTINDENAFEQERQRILGLTSLSAGKPFAITSWSLDHEINRTTLIQEAIDNRDFDAAEQIVSAVGVGNYESVEEFVSANP